MTMWRKFCLANLVPNGPRAQQACSAWSAKRLARKLTGKACAKLWPTARNFCFRKSAILAGSESCMESGTDLHSSRETVAWKLTGKACARANVGRVCKGNAGLVRGRNERKSVAWAKYNVCVSGTLMLVEAEHCVLREWNKLWRCARFVRERNVSAGDMGAHAFVMWDWRFYGCARKRNSAYLRC